MSSDPVNVALREITETKHLLEALITSSESFDYMRAKAALEELRVKVRAMAKLQVELQERQRARAPGRIVVFRPAEH